MRSTAAATEFDWARKFSSSTASGLRVAADLLPQAELELERQGPAIQGSLRTIASGDAEKALPVVGRALTSGAEAAARTGLRLVSSGLGMAADGLPAAGNAVNSAVEAAMPSVMSGAHASADAARAMAIKMASPGGLPANTPEMARDMLPGLLNGAASGLEMFAEGAPSAKQAVAYAADKAMPVLQTALRVSSELSADAASVPLPDEAQVTTSLRAMGVDPQRLTVQAGDFARQASASAAKAAEQLPANAAKVAEQLPLPKRKAPMVATASPSQGL